MSILVSQLITTLHFICGDNEVNVVACMTASYIATNLSTIMIVLRYIGPPLTNQTIVQGSTHDNELFSRLITCCRCH